MEVWRISSMNNKFLRLQFLRTEDVNQATLMEMYNLWTGNFDGKTEYKDFIDHHRQFDNTVLMLDTQAGDCVCGMFLYTVIPAALKEKETGSGLVHDHYRRQGIHFNITSNVVLKERRNYPSAELYMVMNFLNYNTFSAQSNISSNSYPRYDRPTPEGFQRVIDYYALHILNLGHTYNRERGVVCLQRSVKEELGKGDLRDPHIKFFAERNPNWSKGNALIVVFKIPQNIMFAEKPNRSKL